MNCLLAVRAVSLGDKITFNLKYIYIYKLKAMRSRDYFESLKCKKMTSCLIYQKIYNKKTSHQFNNNKKMVTFLCLDLQTAVNS